MINLALQNIDPLSIVPSVDEIGHGTMISGIIGGSYDSANSFKGIVPQSEFVVVKLKPAKKLNKEIFSIPEDKLCYEETDIIAALSYLTKKANELKRPIAICVALGTSQGGHNGKGATSSFLNYITHSSHTGVAVAAGNEGNRRRHFSNEIQEPYYTDFELNIDAKDTSFPMEIWTASPYRISLDVTTPTGETIRDIYPRINECRQLNFIFNSSKIWINNILSESDTGDQIILLRFEKAVHGIWRFRVHSIDQENALFHVWLPSGMLISDNTFFFNSDSSCTLTSPGNAEAPLVVANYNEQTHSIAPDSSRGYTRYNLIKPDLAAPGFHIMAPLPNGRFGALSGTGASCAHATGIIAMILEWTVVQGRYSTITGTDINRLLIRGANREPNIAYPNTQNGYGFIDIYGLFQKLI